MKLFVEWSGVLGNRDDNRFLETYAFLIGKGDDNRKTHLWHLNVPGESCKPACGAKGKARYPGCYDRRETIEVCDRCAYHFLEIQKKKNQAS